MQGKNVSHASSFKNYSFVTKNHFKTNK
ncbi:hypothetical protein AGR7C_Lc150059 [Agrobacterium deltaense Zutra 3/1]|uniref:Uncharacterized protein n=1 Tax=Agrobacterium deltaense Zutra 3/1 TaxID=1183427 RepID=A0A1S7REW2_9HYPH|nr:hypothetical protein AGR7C_Lc150059 [Agrobacterium deltaense Zutra 3/1]